MPSGIYKRKPHSEETKRKIGLANSKALKGRSVSEEVKLKIKKKMKELASVEGFSQKMRERMIFYYNKIGRKEQRSYKHYGNLAIYRNWRTKIFERDKHTCQICYNKNTYLQAHHIKSWAEYPELRYDIKNGVCLCRECHIKITLKQKKKEYFSNFFNGHELSYIKKLIPINSELYQKINYFLPTK